MADTDFDPSDFDSDLEITDFDQLWDYDVYDFEDLQTYEFHGTGDTGGET